MLSLGENETLTRVARGRDSARAMPVQAAIERGFVTDDGDTIRTTYRVAFVGSR